jgi:CheY-like chemotaxis protein
LLHRGWPLDYPGQNLLPSPSWDMQIEIPNPKSTAVAAPPCRGLVLILDDEEENRLLLRDPLEARGHRIAEAKNGEDALRQVAVCRPDVILLDVMLPRMGGLEICRRLKEDRRISGRNAAREQCHLPPIPYSTNSRRNGKSPSNSFETFSRNRSQSG